MTEEMKFCRQSRVYRSGRVFPNDFNNHNTLFGGRLLSNMDQVASIAAAKHSRRECVTASVDAVEFLHPIRPEEYVTFEAFVVWTGTSSMVVFLKVYTENLRNGEQKIASIAYFTFIALDENGRPYKIPGIVPETEEERYLYETAKQRNNYVAEKKQLNKELVSFLKKKL
ncbi:acyl-CoA thioesterase [Caryophanon tenue]|uniref:Acyl-CoA thioesterase n=1 Tax=Caryophanon tenue TaxID=33978 RepID=A0A1C0YI31_9BACL|nr:acyl-CoA thioesterase [Caryophanon tenue]OCS86773.1 acyl-CoA thioesterase [Caryophanon tenue]